MGYAHYVLTDGREAGYGVKDTCNTDRCTEEIDRGLAYLCGETPGGDEHGCGGYFCGGHLYYGYFDDSDEHRMPPHQMCGACLDRWKLAGHPGEDKG